jgi:hypothetical protein
MSLSSIRPIRLVSRFAETATVQGDKRTILGAEIACYRDTNHCGICNDDSHNLACHDLLL